MKALLVAFLCVCVASLSADTFTNRCADGRVFLTTVQTVPKQYGKVVTCPMPPGMRGAFVTKSIFIRKTVRQAVTKTVQAVPLKDYLAKTNATTQVIVGKRPLPLRRASKAFVPAGTVPITEPMAPPVIIDSKLDQPVIFPGGEVILCHVTNIKAVQLAGFDCMIRYTADFKEYGESGDFYQSPTDRIVEVNLIIPMDQDWPMVVWEAMEYHRAP